MKDIINHNHYDLIHTHTPFGGALGRFAAVKAREKGTKVLYTAHGFHFHKQASIFSWMIYFPIEWLLSFVTDALITINSDDYILAKKYLNAKKTYYVHGIGFKTKEKSNKDIDLKKAFNIPSNHIIMTSVGELNNNKYHELILKVLHKLKKKDITYLVVGRGSLEDYLHQK